MSAKYKLEYIWLDGYLPEPNLRSKTKIVDEAPKTVADCPLWGFDGSSTQQAEGHDSDCMLHPVALYPDSARRNGFLVLCEVHLPKDKGPHPSNFRATVDDLFAGEKADHIKRCAEDMANVIYSKINAVPDPRFDPANLTPEQRERYARYKASATA